MISLKEQKSSQIVDVGPFLRDEYAVYPEGARDKVYFVWPERTETSYSFCIPLRLYMFKLSRREYPHQFWVEIFSYQLGCLCGVRVPPAFVAYDSENQTAGALIEWFYDQDKDSYLRGGDIMQSLIVGYEIEKGLKHNIQSIFDFLKTLSWGKENWLRDWAKMIIFDALIGNSDRHQGNWGIITKKGLISSSNENVEIMMSPAFDNGTSMGVEILEKNFGKFNDLDYMERYVKRGKPHLRWDLNQERKTRDNHERFIEKIIQAYPHVRDDMINCLQFTKDQVKEIFERLENFKITPCFTKTRADFMLNLLCYRR